MDSDFQGPFWSVFNPLLPPNMFHAPYCFPPLRDVPSFIQGSQNPRISLANRQTWRQRACITMCVYQIHRDVSFGEVPVGDLSVGNVPVGDVSVGGSVRPGSVRKLFSLFVLPRAC